MTDLSAFFASDDAVFDLAIMGRDPETKEDVETGVTFRVRSLKNPDSVATVKRLRNEIMGKRMANADDVPHAAIGEMTFMETGMDPSDEQLAHCVVGWDWNGKTFGKLDLKFSVANVIEVFKAAPWIRAQVLTKAAAIVDFTKA